MALFLSGSLEGFAPLRSRDPAFGNELAAAAQREPMLTLAITSMQASPSLPSSRI
jgi:hypothetical protein